MKCQDCNIESVMRPVDMAIDDNCAEENTSNLIVFYWSCPRCGAVHTTFGEPIQWEL